MKMKNQIILFTLLIALAFSSCKKDEELAEENTSTPIQLRSSLSLQPASYWGGDTFELDQVYNVNGVDVKFAEIRFFLSNFEIHDMMNNHIDLGGYVLVEAGSTDALELPGTDLIHAHGIHMALGIDSLANFNDPAISEAPLNDFTMHWSWNTGYKFVKIEGEHDADGDGEFETFSIHAATAGLYREMSFDVMEDLEEGENNFTLDIDYQTLFTNVDFSALEGTHGASALTNEIADQIQQNALSLN